MKRQMILAACWLCAAGPALGQDLESAEVVVTGMRVEQDEYSDEMPAVGLRQAADFLVQQVAIRGDTRDPAQRREEIRAMLERAVRLAPQHGVELAFGDYILTPLTIANIEDLAVQSDNRPDSERVVFLVKAALAGKESGSAAQSRISRYIAAVPEVGRAQLDEWGDATLSVVGPDSYRTRIAARASLRRVSSASISAPVIAAAAGRRRRSERVNVVNFSPSTASIAPISAQRSRGSSFLPASTVSSAVSASGVLRSSAIAASNSTSTGSSVASSSP